MEGDGRGGGVVAIAGLSVPVGFGCAEVNGSLRPLAGVRPSTEDMTLHLIDLAYTNTPNTFEAVPA
jgi:hypothetical protein